MKGFCGYKDWKTGGADRKEIRDWMKKAREELQSADPEGTWGQWDVEGRGLKSSAFKLWLKDP